jgi:hypothetical protein
MLTDEEIIRKAYAFYENERKTCDEMNSIIGAFMELLRLEREVDPNWPQAER